MALCKRFPIIKSTPIRLSTESPNPPASGLVLCHLHAGRVGEIDIRPAVAIVIDQSNASAHRLHDVLHLRTRLMLEVNPGRCRDVDELRITGKRPARPQATAWACPSGPKPPPKYTYKPVRHSGSTMPIYSCNSFLRIGLNLFRLDLQFLVQPVELLFRLFQLLVDLD